MTIEELRLKHPQETKNWTDKQCQEYCRSLEVLTNIFIDYTEKRLNRLSQSTKLPIDPYEHP